MAGTGKVPNDACAFEDWREDGHIVNLASGLPGIIGNQHITGCERFGWISLQKMLHPGCHSIDMPGGTSERLRDHGATRIKYAAGQITRLAQDGAKGGTYQGYLL